MDGNSRKDDAMKRKGRIRLEDDRSTSEPNAVSIPGGLLDMTPIVGGFEAYPEGYGPLPDGQSRPPIPTFHRRKPAWLENLRNSWKSFFAPKDLSLKSIDNWFDWVIQSIEGLTPGKRVSYRNSPGTSGSPADIYAVVSESSIDDGYTIVAGLKEQSPKRFHSLPEKPWPTMVDYYDEESVINHLCDLRRKIRMAFETPVEGAFSRSQVEFFFNDLRTRVMAEADFVGKSLHDAERTRLTNAISCLTGQWNLLRDIYVRRIDDASNLSSPPWEQLNTSGTQVCRLFRRWPSLGLSTGPTGNEGLLPSLRKSSEGVRFAMLSGRSYTDIMRDAALQMIAVIDRHASFAAGPIRPDADGNYFSEENYRSIEHDLAALAIDEMIRRMSYVRPESDRTPLGLGSTNKQSDQYPSPASSTAWPPDDGWHFRPGEAAFCGLTFNIMGRMASVLSTLANARGAARTWSELASGLDNSDVEMTTVRGYVSQLRTVLRQRFGISNADPIPSVERGGGSTAWRLNSDLLRCAAQKQR
jgi:hypothetical protein